jgi:hypothetical protein
MRIGLVSALLFGAALAFAPVAFADPDGAHPWDASWAGGWEDGGDGVQLIVAGNEVIGFFYHGDYLAVTQTAALPADGSLSFTWARGKATLRVINGKERTIPISEDGAADKVIKLQPR